MEAALRNTAMQRHLAALKTAATGIAAPRLLALVTGTARLTELRTHTAADADFLLARAARRTESRKADRGFLFAGLFCHDLFHHFHEVTHFMDHAAGFRRVLALDNLMQTAQAEAANRLPHIVGAADKADHPLNLDGPGGRCFFLSRH